jgi:predicted N-acetyltransferase YhbS
MDSIVYRELQIDEAPLLGSIDRAERIDGIYRVTDGALEYREMRQSYPTWSATGLADYVARLQALLESGGSVFAAWDARTLVGVGSLDASGVGGDRALLCLDMLYVHAGYRGQGIGRALTRMVVDRARALGAASLYISATPTKRTVDVYLRMGAEILKAPDPELFSREPEDIHLLLRLV